MTYIYGNCPYLLGLWYWLLACFSEHLQTAQLCESCTVFEFIQSFPESREHSANGAVPLPLLEQICSDQYCIAQCGHRISPYHLTKWHSWYLKVPDLVSKEVLTYFFQQCKNFLPEIFGHLYSRTGCCSSLWYLFLSWGSWIVSVGKMRTSVDWELDGRHKPTSRMPWDSFKIWYAVKSGHHLSCTSVMTFHPNKSLSYLNSA